MAKTYQELAEKTLSEPSDANRFDVFITEYKEFQESLAKNFRNLINLHEYTMADMSKVTGYDVALINRSASRKYAVSGYRTMKACYQAFGISCQEFVTDEKMEVSLPPGLGVFVNTLLEARDQDFLFDVMKRVRAYKTDGKDTIDEARGELFRERFLSYCAEHHCSYSNVFRCTGLCTVTLKVPEFIENKNTKQIFEGYKLSTFVLLSIMTGVPMDYFLARDYTRFLPISFRWHYASKKKSSNIPVVSSTIRNIVGMLLSFPAEARTAFIADILAERF